MSIIMKCFRFRVMIREWIERSQKTVFSMLEEEEVSAKIVLKDLRGYLQGYLTEDEDFISGLSAAGLLGYHDAFCAVR